MKMLFYFLMSVIGLTGTITGTINLCTPGNVTVDNVVGLFFYTLIAMGVFLLFGYGLVQTYKKYPKRNDN